MKGSPSSGLVFARIVDGRSDLARGRLSDGAVTALTRTPDRDETWPYWSERSQRLLFQVGALREPASSDLYLWLPNTGEEIQVTKTPRRSERWATWSPTRRQFAFAFVDADASGVALYDLDTRAARLVASSARSQPYLRPTFSPDGDRILAQRRGPSGRSSGIWLLEDGAQPQPLTRDPRWFDLKAWFTRDAKRVLFSRRPAGGGGHFEIDDIGVARRDLRVIARSENADDHSARPSPVRDEIAFVSNRDGNFDVYLAATDGSDPHPLTRTERNEFAPRWSPDGELLAVTATAAGYGMPRLSDLSSLEHTRVVVLNRSGDVLFEAAGFMPDWMPPW